MQLKDLISNYRNEKGLSQRQFALACGLSNGYVSMLEKGINPNTNQPLTPSLPVLKKLASGMHLTMEELFSQADDIPVDLINPKGSLRLGDICSIGDVLRHFRKKKRVTLGALATRIRVSPEYLSKIEAGRILPSLDIVDSIMEALGIPLSKLHNNRNYVELSSHEVVRCTNNDCLFIDPYSDCFDIPNDDDDGLIPYQYKDFFIDALSDDEIRLLFSFARLNAAGRARILEELELLEKSPSYQRKLPPAEPVVKAEAATPPSLEAELAELKRQNQELAAKVAVMEEEDAGQTAGG